MIAALAFKALGWLTGSKAGRWLAVGILLVAVAALLLLRARRSGYSARESEEAAAKVRGIIERVKTDENIRKMASADRAAALRRWVR
jgi:hypothetical protein